jgi:outer membrane immunogenic protein
MGALVVGVETDFQGTAIEGTVRGRLAPGAVAVTGTSETPWFGTIRGRLGYAADRWLFYVTGGGAYSRNEVAGRIGGTPFSASATGWSWTVGGGIETALAHNWSVKGEYLFIDTPDKLPVPAGANFTGSSAESHVIRLGVNYRF